MKKLQERAMLVNLSVSSWSGRTKDNSVSDEVLCAKGAERDSGTWWTYMVPKKNTQAISCAIGRIRTAHAKYTLPWMDGGLRILPADMVFEYTKAIRDAENQFKEVVQNFIDDYPNIVANASKRLGKLLMGKHFPSVHELSRRFGVSVNILPISDAGDFRVQLDEQVDVDEIKNNITNSIQKSLQDAMNTMWEQLGDLIGKVQNTLSQPDKIFRDSLIENLSDFCKRIPKMNLTDDADLESLRQEVMDKLAGLHPDDLREEKGTRKKAADDAAELLERLRSYYGK